MRYIVENVYPLIWIRCSMWLYTVFYFLLVIGNGYMELYWAHHKVARKIILQISQKWLCNRKMVVNKKYGLTAGLHWNNKTFFNIAILKTALDPNQAVTWVANTKWLHSIAVEIVHYIYSPQKGIIDKACPISILTVYQ